MSSHLLGSASAAAGPTTATTASMHYNIDDTHCDIMREFTRHKCDAIPKLREEIKQLQKDANVVEEENARGKLESSNIEKLLELRELVAEKEFVLRSMKQKERNYLLNNSKYVFDYFENKKDISIGRGKVNVDKVNNFFKVVSSTAAAAAKAAAATEGGSSGGGGGAGHYHKYWQNIHDELLFAAAAASHIPLPPALDRSTKDACASCKSGEMVAYEEEGILICNNRECGCCSHYIVDNSRPTSKDPPNEVSYTAYIRLNHFKEILSQFQAKETTLIPEQVIVAIRNRIKKERITDVQKHLTYAKMREILRKLGFNKYFEHIQYINSLFGIKPPVMSEELYQTLCILFIEIQHPYTIHCPANRTNFFNYTYTFYQLCVLLDQTQYLPFIPLLKDRQKQLEQDQIWAKICRELDWEFIPTV